MAFGMGFFRRHSGKLLGVLVALLMVSWLAAGPIMRMLTPETSRGTIFGEKVSDYDFRSAASALRLLRGDRFTEDDIWRMLAVLHEADRLDVRVTPEEITMAVRDWIAMMTRAGEADLNEAYELFLAQNRITDEFVRFAWGKNLRASKVRQIFGGAFHVTEAEKWRRFTRMRLKVGVKKLSLGVSEFTDAVIPPAEDQLRAYFDENSETYRIPERTTLAYVILRDEDVTNLVDISDEEVEEYYEENKVAEFLLPLVEQDIGEEEPGALEPTDAVIEAELAALEPTDADAQGDGAPGDDEDDASDEPLYRPLSEVADRIRATLREREINAVLSDIQADYLMQETKDLGALAESYAIEYVETPPLSAGDEEEAGILAEAITSTGQTVLAQVLLAAPAMNEFPMRSLRDAQGADGRILYAIQSYEAESQPAFEQVEEHVRADFIEREAARLAISKAADLKAKIESDGWETLAPGYLVEEVTFANDSPSPELVEAGASVEEGGFGGPVLSMAAAHVFEVKQRVEPTWEEFQEAQAAENRLAPLVMQFGAETVARYFAELELEKQVAIEVGRRQEEMRDFVARWEDSLLERARLTRSEPGEPARDLPPPVEF